MTTDSPPSSRTKHGFQPCPEGTFFHSPGFAAPATILDHRPTSPTCTLKGSFPRGVMGIDRSATMSHGDRKQSLQDRGHFGGHPPGVGAAHQPRAEGSIPYGELFGHVMVPGHGAGGITTHCFRIPNHRARMANHHFESPTHRYRTPTASFPNCIPTFADSHPTFANCTPPFMNSHAPLPDSHRTVPELHPNVRGFPPNVRELHPIVHEFPRTIPGLPPHRSRIASQRSRIPTQRSRTPTHRAPRFVTHASRSPKIVPVAQHHPVSHPPTS